MPKMSYPKDPLVGRSGYTHLLLRELSDDEVVEFCDYWAARCQGYKVEGRDYAAWQASKRLSSGHHEADRRGSRRGC